MLFVSLTFGDLGSTAKERCQMVMRNFCWQQVINMLNTSSKPFLFLFKKIIEVLDIYCHQHCNISVKIFV